MITLIKHDAGKITSIVQTQPEFVDKYDGYIPTEEAGISISTHCVVDGVVTSIGNCPSEVHAFNYSSFTWEVNLELAIEAARNRRDVLFSKSDWTQLPDVPLSTKDKWTEYRQALRDITSQAGYPFQITWPEPPN